MFSAGFITKYLSERSERGKILERAKNAAEKAKFKVYKLISSKTQKQNARDEEVSVEHRHRKIKTANTGKNKKREEPEQSQRKMAVLLSTSINDKENGDEKGKEIDQDEEKESVESPNHSMTAEDDWCFYTVGCQGNAKEAQLQVAELMRKIASAPTRQKPRFILILGDNFYDWGVSDPEDKMFETHFHQIYSVLGIPCFVILGNHDENLHNASIPMQEKGIPRGMHQVVHSYLGDEKFTTEEKIALYENGMHAEKKAYPDEGSSLDDQEKQPVLDADDLPDWNMPSRAYALDCGNTVIFCIDSNMYAQEYFAYVNGEYKDRAKLALVAEMAWISGSINHENNVQNNQPFWLAKTVNQAKARNQQVILALHHPPHTPGKRAFKSDLSIYLSANEIAKAKEHFPDLWKTATGEPKNVSYNDLIFTILKEQGLEFDAVLAAHDHAIYNIVDTNEEYRLFQLTSGGGGGGLQHRVYFQDQEQMGCYIREHGFTEVICSNTNIRFVIHTIGGQQLEFDHNHLYPIRNYPEGMRQDEMGKIEKFCRAVHAGLNMYFKFLANNQRTHKSQHFSKNPKQKNMRHGHEGVDRAHTIWAYISQSVADDYTTTLEKIFKDVSWKGQFTQPTEESLINCINTEIANAYGKNVSLETLMMVDLIHSQTVNRDLKVG